MPTRINIVKRHRRAKPIVRGDLNDIARSKGDRPLIQNTEAYQSNFDAIDWSKGRKPDSEKPYRIRRIRESDRPFERRASTP